MKIILVNKYHHPCGGPETGILMRIKGLESVGHTIIPFSMQHPDNLKTDYDKYFVSNVDYNNHSRLPWDLAKTTFRIIYNFEAKKKMEDLIKVTKPDLAHLHNIYHQLSPSILPVLKKINVPVVMTLHDFKLLCPNYTFMRKEIPCEECQGKHFYKAVKYKCIKNSYLKSAVCVLEMYLHKLSKIYLKNIDCFIALSRFTQEKLVRYGLPQEKIKYLPNYVDVPELKPDSVEEKYILFLGRLSDKNGIFHLIKAMRVLPAIKLKVAGEGEQKKLIQDYLRENKMRNVEMVGFLTGEELKKTIINSAFLVFPNNCYHNCPMSILESFAYGKPAIGANLGSVPELIEDGINGLLFEPGNVEDLAEKIKYLYHHPLLAQKMGISARKKVEEKYSEEEYYKKLLGIYDNLIKNGGKSYV